MATSVAFDRLAIEMVQEIASYLDDKSLGNFRCVGKSTHAAIDQDNNSFWRKRFGQEFEKSTSILPSGKPGLENKEHKDQYQKRKRVLHILDKQTQALGVKPSLQFAEGLTKREKVALRVLRDLLIDAFGDNKTNNENYVSKNLGFVKHLVEHTNLLRILGRNSNKRSPSSGDVLDRNTALLYTLQILLAAELLTFNPHHKDDQFSFPEAQRAAYGHNESSPIFIGRTGFDVNVAWLLKNLQFWRHHLMRAGEVLRDAFLHLPAADRPRFWTEQLSPSTRTIGHRWIGSYAFVSRTTIKAIRRGFNEHTPVIDELSGEESDDPFQEIFFSVPSAPKPFDPLFESCLHSTTKAYADTSRTTRAQKASHANFDPAQAEPIRIVGGGVDGAERFHCDGYLNPLPAQSGVPGFQRFTMMKYFVQHGEVDYGALWAYEGVLLPGGKVVVGRWWCPTDGEGARMYSGPFILWNVPEREETSEGEVGESEFGSEASSEASEESEV